MSSSVQVIGDHIVVSPKIVEQFRSVFPGCKHAHRGGRDYCAVPNDIDNARILRNMGWPVESPIRHDYDWPGRFTPYKHQIHTAEFFTLNGRAFCLNGMGTGKTLAALWAADYLKKRGDVHKVLIVSPLSTLERVWADEIFINFPGRTYTVLHGTRQKRLKLFKQDYDFYIINHDGMKIIEDELAQRPDIDLIILDECAVYRNARTTRWKTMKKVVTPERKVWGLTGTPTPNEPTDAFGQVKLIKPENYQGSFTRFKNTVMQQVSTFKWIPRRGAEQTVSQVMRPALRYALADCIDLPETIKQTRQTQLTAQQQRHYNQLRAEAVTVVEEQGQVTAVNAAVLVNKLVQAACGVMYGSNGEVIELDFGHRLKTLIELIEETDEKVIVFVPLTGVLDALERELSKQWTVATVDGSVSSTKRNKIFRDFQQAKNPHILLANPGTMAHGLTLTAASTIIWYAPISKNEIYTQANARIVRPGQKNVTNIINMYATSVERRAYDVLDERARLQDVVLDLAKQK